MRLSELGQLGLLAELERRGLIVGVEHDAALLEGGLVVTQDALVENVHFRLDWIGFRDLGWRVAAVNLSDLAASGADPVALVVTGPLGAAGAAFRGQSYVRPPLRLAEGKALARHAHAMLDISDGIAVDVPHIARRSGVRCVVELERVPLAEGARIDDLAFGEDFELLAAVADPGSPAVVGRVEEGEGVELLLAGEPHELRGWEHFA